MYYVVKINNEFYYAMNEANFPTFDLDFNFDEKKEFTKFVKKSLQNNITIDSFKKVRDLPNILNEIGDDIIEFQVLPIKNEPFFIFSKEISDKIKEYKNRSISDEEMREIFNQFCKKYFKDSQISRYLISV